MGKRGLLQASIPVATSGQGHPAPRAPAPAPAGPGRQGRGPDRGPGPHGQRDSPARERGARRPYHAAGLARGHPPEGDARQDDDRDRRPPRPSAPRATGPSPRTRPSTTASTWPWPRAGGSRESGEGCTARGNPGPGRSYPSARARTTAEGIWTTTTCPPPPRLRQRLRLGLGVRERIGKWDVGQRVGNDRHAVTCPSRSRRTGRCMTVMPLSYQSRRGNSGTQSRPLYEPCFQRIGRLQLGVL